MGWDGAKEGADKVAKAIKDIGELTAEGIRAALAGGTVTFEEWTRAIEDGLPKGNITATQLFMQQNREARARYYQDRMEVLEEENKQLKADLALAKNGRHMIEENKRLDMMLGSALDRNTELEEKFCDTLSSIRRAITELEEKVQKVQVYWDDKDEGKDEDGEA